MKENFVSDKLQDIQFIHKQMVLALKQQRRPKQQDQVIFNLESKCVARPAQETWGFVNAH